MTNEAVPPSGGFVSYYLCDVRYPQRDVAPYQAECEDIVHALKMTFDEGCAFKAIWRSAAARLGNRKPGHNAKYDAEKTVHYAKRMLKHILDAQKAQVIAQPSISSNSIGQSV